MVLINVTKSSILDIVGRQFASEFIRQRFSKVFISKAHRSTSDTRKNCVRIVFYKIISRKDVISNK